MYDNLIALANLIIIISSVILVIFYGDSKRLKISFSMLNIGILLWVITLQLYYSDNFIPYLVQIGRLNFIAISFATVTYFFFIRIFTNEEFKLNKKEILYILFSLIVLYLTLFTDLIVKTEIALPNGERETIFGNLYYIYLFKLLFDFLISFYVAFMAYRISKKEKQSQIKIFVLSTLVALLIGGFTNLILPQFGIFTLQKSGIFGLSVLNIAIVYLIVKYQFLNIRILLGRFLFYFLLMLFVIANFLVIEFFIQTPTLQDNLYYKILFFIVISFFFVYFFDKIINILKKEVRTQFINPGYDPYEVTEDFNKKVSRLVTIKDISQEYIDIIKKTLRTNKTELILTRNVINGDVFLKIWEYIPEQIILYDKLRILIKETVDKNKREILEATYQRMHNEDVRVLLSLTDKSKQMAFLIIGKKEVDSVYTMYDQEFLLNLSQVVSISIARAFLYEEVENFNKVLKNRVEIQTKELNDKVKQLEEARRKEADMIDIMGHELRTPVTVIKLNTDLLLNFSRNITKGKDEAVKYITRIKDAVDTEIKLINTLLSSAKLEGDKIDLNKEKIDIYKDLDMVVHSEKKLAEEKGISLINKVREGSHFVYADHARVVEIFSNLVSNAVKYTERGSVIVDAVDMGEYIRINIQDTGRGIRERDLSRLGTKFFRTETYIESQQRDKFNIVRPGGTGLGLYITFGLTEKMGGRVEVKSKLGQGSTFSVFLPKYSNQNTEKGSVGSKDMFVRLKLK